MGYFFFEQCEFKAVLQRHNHWFHSLCVCLLVLMSLMLWAVGLVWWGEVLRGMQSCRAAEQMHGRCANRSEVWSHVAAPAPLTLLPLSPPITLLLLHLCVPLYEWLCPLIFIHTPWHRLIDYYHILPPGIKIASLRSTPLEVCAEADRCPCSLSAAIWFAVGMPQDE